jgi:hypothetical protein
MQTLGGLFGTETASTKAADFSDFHQDQECLESFVFPLTRDELAESARQMAEESQEKTRLEDELEKVRKDFKAKIDRQEVKIAAIVHQIQFGQQKEVNCVKRIFFEKGIVQFIFEGRILKERPMEEEERQLRWDGKGPELPPKELPAPNWEEGKKPFDGEFDPDSWEDVPSEEENQQAIEEIFEE